MTEKIRILFLSANPWTTSRILVDEEDKGVGLGVTVARKVQVWGDRDLLFEAIANLVDNAVKFTPPGGEVRLELKSDGATSLVRVSDTGPGISEQERDMVLRRFYRSDKMRNTPGIGLGLSLVAAIVKLHGFRLIIGPAPGGQVEIVAGARRQDHHTPVRDVASRMRNRGVMTQPVCEACEVGVLRHV